MCASLSLALIALSLGCGKTKEEPDEPGAGRGGNVSQGGADGTSTGGRASGTGGGIGTIRGGSTSGGTDGEGGAGTAEGGAGGSTVIEPPHASTQVDLLFVVDNSIGMADKQFVLSHSVPTLINRLLHPRCLDDTGAANGEDANDAGECVEGTPEFRAVTDLHVGVVTTSLGSHGGGGACVDTNGDDRGQLLPLARPPDPQYPYTTWKDSGFLSFNTDPALGISDEPALQNDLRNMILGAGQSGCGFEAPLEAMYRFLIDPQPLTMATPVVTDGAGVTSPVYDSSPTNPVLKQRSEFLRPNSTLAIVMISDENDCSIRDEGQGWLVATSSLGAQSFRMPRATTACQQNPNSPCCHSCAAGAPAGCPNPTSDAACALGSWSALDDNLNLRCFDHKGRFGFDLLYPLSRYVDGLTKKTVVDRSGNTVPNPLFPRGGRTPSMVFLTGIVGVPWQDLAPAAAFEGQAPLEYLSPAELVSEGRWDVVLGSPGDAMTPPSPPTDKLMFETPKDRSTLFGTAAHPLLGAGASLSPSSTMGRPNRINGHEANNFDNSTLQYACIMRLPQDRPTCTGPGCDCVATDAMGNPIPNMYNRPICEGTTQTYTKAHPSIRQLRVIQELAALTGNAMPASVCWKALGGPALGTLPVPDQGYDPAIHLLLNTMAPQLKR